MILKQQINENNQWSHTIIAKPSNATSNYFLRHPEEHKPVLIDAEHGKVVPEHSQVRVVQLSPHCRGATDCLQRKTGGRQEPSD